jgi:HlyD family secretion protein
MVRTLKTKFMSTSSSRWKGRAVVIAVIAGLVAGGVWYWKRPRVEEPEYQTAVLARGEVLQVVTATGQLNPVTNVTVGSQISGIIQRLFADFNSRVKEGEVIAQLDPATYKANVASAEGDLANARANLELTQVDFRRADELRKGQLISQSEFDKATASLHQAEAQVKMKEASLQRAQVDLSRCTIYSPVDGIVISRNVDVGQTVAASMSAPTLFIIANDLTKMQIDANVAEADVGGVEVGQAVEFTVDAFPYRTFRGKVMQVRNAPVTVQNVVTYDAVVGVGNDDLKLKPGMTANVSIVIARRDDVVKIPNAALRFRLPEASTGAAKTNAAPALTSGSGGGRGGRGGAGSGPRGERGDRSGQSPARTVYLLGEDAKPKPATVKLGISDGIATEVLDGVSEGDKVITSVVQSKSGAAPASNPFGSGMPRRF